MHLPGEARYQANAAHVRMHTRRQQLVRKRDRERGDVASCPFLIDAFVSAGEFHSS